VTHHPTATTTPRRAQAGGALIQFRLIHSRRLEDLYNSDTRPVASSAGGIFAVGNSLQFIPPGPLVWPGRACYERCDTSLVALLFNPDAWIAALDSFASPASEEKRSGVRPTSCVVTLSLSSDFGRATPRGPRRPVCGLESQRYIDNSVQHA